jgi:hypothetical protein
MGVTIFLLPVPRGGATLRTGCDKWQRRNCIISVSTKRKGKWSEHLASFFFIIYQYTLVSPVLCLVQEVHTDLYLSRHPSASRRTDIPWQLGVKTRPSDVKRALPGEERDKLYSALISAGRKTGLSEDTTALSSVSILFTQLLPKRGEMIKDHLTNSFITCTYSSLNHG